MTLKGMTMNKTLFFAFLCAPAVLFADNQATEPGKPVTMESAANTMADQQIQLLQQDIREKRRQIVAANLPLTTEEGAKFWPVYDRYIGELSKILDRRYAQIKTYAANYTNLNDQQASDYVSQLIDTDKAITDLRVQFRPNFERVLSKKKAAMFTQLDRRVQML